MGAKFRVEAVFSIAGRGTVLQGTIVSGEVSAGMHLIAPGSDRRRRIAAVEGILSIRHLQRVFQPQRTVKGLNTRYV